MMVTTCSMHFFVLIEPTLLAVFHHPYVLSMYYILRPLPKFTEVISGKPLHCYIPGKSLLGLVRKAQPYVMALK